MRWCFGVSRLAQGLPAETRPSLGTDWLPLPPGEGWGEGKARAPMPFPCRSGPCARFRGQGPLTGAGEMPYLTKRIGGTESSEQACGPLTLTLSRRERGPFGVRWCFGVSRLAQGLPAETRPSLGTD
ncbi:hypothetical protein Pssp01_52950 [Pseudomonas sp. NBRC 100443]|nr:hypothetical protein Pssp01_52950 [Pseudomonas sp. NBRC 100443]